MDPTQFEQLLAPGGFLAVFVAAIGFVLREARGLMKERNSDAVKNAEDDRDKRLAAEGKRDEARAAEEMTLARLYIARQMLIGYGAKPEELP